MLPHNKSGARETREASQAVEEADAAWPINYSKAAVVRAHAWTLPFRLFAAYLPSGLLKGMILRRG